MAAGAATIYRNYFAPVGDGIGQTSERQLDGLADLGAALGDGPGSVGRRPVDHAQRLRVVHPRRARGDHETPRLAERQNRPIGCAACCASAFIATWRSRTARAGH